MDKPVTQSRIFKRGTAFNYLEDQDRLLSAAGEAEFRFGFIGCGMMGQEHMRNALLVGRASVAGIYDPAKKSVQHALESLSKLQSSAPTVYESLEAACADPTTDALFIATPNFTHLEVIRSAACSNKAIFLEKPIATNIADAYEVCQLAADHDAPVRLGLQYRYKATYQTAFDEVFDRCSVGQVHSVNMLEHRFPFLDKVGQWNKFNANTGGALVEKCCHYFDLINLFAGGRAQQVFALGSQAVNFKNFSYDNQISDGLDQAQVSIQYDNGVIGSLSLNMFSPGAHEALVVCGDAGRLVAQEKAELGEENKNSVEVWRGENGASSRSTPNYPTYISRAGHHGSTFFEHAAFADELAGVKTAGPALSDGFWSVVVGAAAQTSIERRQAVDVAELLPKNFDASLFDAPLGKLRTPSQEKT